MLFNSWQFAVFFPVAWALMRLAGQRFRWVALLAASVFFYMCWDPELVLLLFFTIAVNYLCALGIGRAESRAVRRLMLGIGLASSLGVLFTYKYFDFFSRSFGFDVTLDLVLPMGISFYTFQTLSYTIDVYRGTLPPERHFGWFALYVSYFPQLVAGPIERADRLLAELKKPYRFNYADAESGLFLMAAGLFKKMVVADTLAKGVNLVYNNVGDYTGLALILATVMFALQIYCDFSGYSDIARGCARTMGVNLMKNFDAPYLSHSVREFWRRWHISLSTWFRDYVYIPLGGGRKRKSLNLMLTFLLSGLWHGASWTFVVWGGLNGAYQLVENALPRRPRGVFAVALTFILICFSWIFFRANTLADAGYIIAHMFEGLSSPLGYLRAGFASLSATKIGAAIVLFEVGVLAAMDFRLDRRLPRCLRWTAFAALVLLIAVLSTKGTVNEFIYFQF